MNVGDKVTVIPFDELDKEKCSVEVFECNDMNSNVCGIAKCLYDRYVGKEHTISKVTTIEGTLTEIDFIFPIGCLKKL